MWSKQRDVSDESFVVEYACFTRTRVELITKNERRCCGVVGNGAGNNDDTIINGPLKFGDLKDDGFFVTWKNKGGSLLEVTEAIGDIVKAGAYYYVARFHGFFSCM